ncbi:aquaporin Z [Chitinophaga caeni]|uniref:Aquaporin Z n=1 Tax=Chitinophaga caeni TaxID=2029983 RepID=A0A291QV68_9BACT|nr:aquaporin Z [Chitinophaga caeni]ATL47763.1 aquaporin Z [Chitinophaga caeni]
MKATSSQKFLAEMFGTFVLVFMGCGSAVIAGSFVGNLGIAFAFGLSVLAMCYAIGHITGCHINPAISISMWAMGKLPAKDMVVYIIGQVVGGILAAGLLYYIAQGNPNYNIDMNGLGANGVGEASPANYSMVSGMIAEVVLTALFLFVVHGATSSYNGNTSFAGLAIGLCLTLIHIVGIPITGVSVNPARSIGPAIFVGGAALSQLWIFIVCPIVGGLIGGLLWKLVDNPPAEKASNY